MDNQMMRDDEYQLIVDAILSNEDFSEPMKAMKHHNGTRLDHSLKVSYYSYKIAKALKLDYADVARGGLLHDFYLESVNEQENIKEKVLLYTLNHPKDALENAQSLFPVSSKEEDIIRTHMFPLDVKLPRYAESWVVNLVDTYVSTVEFGQKFGKQLTYAANFAVIFALNFVRLG